jgi:UDP-N-acetylglucosamine diphosphorylase / glucose-1-phosphate thymidylyltransferase / UDP-N-acetylgalactosamine diphosphorylase / glucosamine-1-phosphate N-acetyltransferase / galactosamine-1-phosphate N-acetyltransferase
MPSPGGLDAVVMAAGEGRRLRPLTERWPKPLLPIDGRPVLATLLRELAEASFDAVTVVVGHLGERLQAFLGDGDGFRLAARYAHQGEPLGSADAVSTALAAGAHPPLLVLGADTVFPPGTIRSTAERWLRSRTIGGLAVREVPVDELPERSSVRAENGLVVSVVEKPRAGARAGTLAGAPLWFLGDELCGYLGDLPGPPFELAVAAQGAIDAGKKVAALEIGPTRDITRPADVMLENFPYLATWSK